MECAGLTVRPERLSHRCVIGHVYIILVLLYLESLRYASSPIVPCTDMLMYIMYTVAMTPSYPLPPSGGSP